MGYMTRSRGSGPVTQHGTRPEPTRGLGLPYALEGNPRRVRVAGSQPQERRRVGSVKYVEGGTNQSNKG